MFKVIWCISDFRQPCMLKTDGRRVDQNGLKFGPQRNLLTDSVHKVLLTVKCSRAVCHSVLFRFLTGLHNHLNYTAT